MAAGVPFLGFTPPRPLRLFYLQAEIRYRYLCERMQQISLPPGLIAAARNTFIATPNLKLLVDADGVTRVGTHPAACFTSRCATFNAVMTSAAWVECGGGGRTAPGESGPSVVIATGHDFQSALLHATNQTMFAVDPAGPKAGNVAFQGFGLAGSPEMLAQRVLD